MPLMAPLFGRLPVALERKSRAKKKTILWFWCSAKCLNKKWFCVLSRVPTLKPL